MMHTAVSIHLANTCHSKHT